MVTISTKHLQQMILFGTRFNVSNAFDLFVVFFFSFPSKTFLSSLLLLFFTFLFFVLLRSTFIVVEKEKKSFLCNFIAGSLAGWLTATILNSIAIVNSDRSTHSSSLFCIFHLSFEFYLLFYNVLDGSLLFFIFILFF